MSVLPAAVRRAVRRRAQNCCEYCLICEDDLLFAHEPDHIIAVQHGGASEAENLALLLQFNTDERLRTRRRLWVAGRYPLHKS